jgi:hypothetical protein
VQTPTSAAYRIHDFLPLQAMETFLATDCPQDSPDLLFAGVLSFICERSLLSHWYRIWDSDGDSPTPEVRRLMETEKLTKINQLNQLSLQRSLGVDHDLWIWLLKRSGLVNVSADGKVSMTSELKWNSFFTDSSSITIEYK